MKEVVIKMESKKGIKKFFNQKMITLLVLLAVVVATFSILSGGDFLKVANIRSILSLMAVSGLLTLGVGYLIISGHIDLSTGAIGTLCGMVMSLFLQSGMPWPIAVIGCLLIGILIGALNALLINVVGFQPFIATTAIASIAQGFTSIFCNGKSVPVRDEVITYIGTGRIFNFIPVSILIMIAAFIIYGLILSKTKFGRSVYLIGGNPQAARLSGLRPVKLSYILFMNCGMLSAMAGMLLAGRLKAGSIGGTSSSQFTGITAAMLGGISFGGGSGSFSGVFVGLLIITGFSNGLSVLGVVQYWQTFASGVLLIFALTIDYFYNRRVIKKTSVGV